MINIFKIFFTPNNSNSLSVSKSERDELSETIINSSAPKTGFYLLLVLATFIVTVGLLKNSIILTIGGMLVAPLLSPILAISLSLTIMNFGVLLRSVKIFAISTIVSLSIAYLLGLLANISLLNISLIEAVIKNDLTVFLIPIAAGAAASFTWAKKELNGSLPGVAVTVTLLPPLTIMGLSLAIQDFLTFEQASLIYFLNVLGIIIGSLVMFLVMGFSKSAKKIIEQIKEEDSN